MKIMNKELEKKAVNKNVARLGQVFTKIGEVSTSSCILFGLHEPKISIELLKSLMK